MNHWLDWVGLLLIAVPLWGLFILAIHRWL
jgi:hypothetical protein